jgi:hypothetical protein
VDGGHPSRSRDPQPLAHRLEVLVVRDLYVAVAELPARLLAEHTGRLARRISLDYAAVDLQVAVRAGQSRGVEPERVGVMRQQCHRHRAGDRVERLLRRLLRPVGASPAPSAKPAALAHRAERFANALDSLFDRADTFEPYLTPREGPGGEVDVGVRESRQHTAPAEVDAVRAR